MQNQNKYYLPVSWYGHHGKNRSAYWYDGDEPTDFTVYVSKRPVTI